MLGGCVIMYSLVEAGPNRESAVVKSLNNNVIIVCWTLLIDMVCLVLDTCV